jgi:hypothetical protein
MIAAARTAQRPETGAMWAILHILRILVNL